MTPLRFGTTIAEAYRFAWQNRNEFFAFAYLPVLAIAILSTLADFVYRVEIPPDWSTLSPETMKAMIFRILFSLAVGTLMYVLFAVPWHRLHILGSEGSTVGAALRWRPRHMRYLIRLALLLGSYIALAMLIGKIAATAGGAAAVSAASVGTIIAMVAQILLFANILRFGVLLAAVAVEDETVAKPTEAWRISRRCGPVMLGLFFIALAPAQLAGLILTGQIVALIGPELVFTSVPLRFVVTLFTEFISFIGIAVLTSVFSIAYRELKAQDAGTV